jgi:hypothetical protein
MREYGEAELQQIEDAAKNLGLVMGVSMAEATFQINRAIEGINRFQMPDFEQAMARLEDQRRQQRWATDPMGLLDWLEFDQWRWFIVNRIGNVQDALGAIASWVEPD